MFKQTAAVSRTNTAKSINRWTLNLLEQFRERTLPQTRREFEKNVLLLYIVEIWNSCTIQSISSKRMAFIISKVGEKE